jgi:hypothetical protein
LPGLLAVRDSGVPAYLLDAHSLELKSAQRTGSIVQQKLIDL